MALKPDECRISGSAVARGPCDPFIQFLNLSMEQLDLGQKAIRMSLRYVAVISAADEHSQRISGKI